MQDPKKGFQAIFNQLTRSNNPYQVFSDFVCMSAYSLHNAVCFNQELEAEYMNIVGRYKPESVALFPQLLAEVVNGVGMCDFLGELFMQLELSNDRIGQFFTPYSVSRMMAELNYGSDLSRRAEAGQDYITLSDPACGAGSTLIAFVDVMRAKGMNPQRQLFVQAVDIDHVAAMMAYIQLALLHVPAEIIVGNSLTLECRRVMRTPAYYMGGWSAKLLRPPVNQSEFPVDNASELSPGIAETTIKEQVPVPKCSGEQFALFDFS